MAETAFALLTPGNNSGVLGLARATLDGTTLTGATWSRPASRRAKCIRSTCTASSTTGPNAPRSSPTTRTATASSKRPRASANAYGPVIAGLTASGDAQFGLRGLARLPGGRGGRDAPIQPDLRARPGGGRRCADPRTADRALRRAVPGVPRPRPAGRRRCRHARRGQRRRRLPTGRAGRPGPAARRGRARHRGPDGGLARGATPPSSSTAARPRCPCSPPTA